MDNLAHSLVGAALAETGLKKKTPLATATLIIGANLPDIDAIAMLIGEDFSLWFRRGWTHGVLAWVLLPVLLVAVMLGWDKWVRRRRNPEAEPVHLGWLVGLSYLGVLTHPFLDWLNTYGVRLLMPFDGQWFYGDSLFIVDPWLWLLCASAVVLAHTQSKLSIAAWSVLGAATSAMVLGFGEIPVLVKMVWGVGVATIVAMRVAGWLEDHTRQLASVALGLAAIYVAAMVSGTIYTRSLATDAFAERGVEVEQILSGPVPGNPLVREGLGPRWRRIPLLFDRPAGRDALRGAAAGGSPRSPEPGRRGGARRSAGARVSQLDAVSELGGREARRRLASRVARPALCRARRVRRGLRRGDRRAR